MRRALPLLVLFVSQAILHIWPLAPGGAPSRQPQCSKRCGRSASLM